MRIGELSTLTNTSQRSLRYYESQGLIGSERSPSGQRHYPAAAVERVALIRALFEAGLSSATMYEVLPCITDPEARTVALEMRLTDELQRIERLLCSLEKTRATLAGLIRQYRV
jgi:DNA-binding transcriptional MerR regulator